MKIHLNISLKVAVVLLLCLVFAGLMRRNAPAHQASAPSVHITRVPPSGSGPERMESIAGEARGINVGQCACKIVIFALGDVWYVQPFVTASDTALAPDGSFTAQTHLGSQYAALLVKASYRPSATLQSLPGLGGEVLALTTVKAVAESAGQPTDKPEQSRTIHFSGFDWQVKASNNPVGPGPNFFSASDENVRVDNVGRLHLRITRRAGQWQCAEVILARQTGFGTYRFYLDSAPENIAQATNAVLGMFTWNDGDAEHHHDEIDCELSRWGVSGNQLGQWVVQPPSQRNLVRFDVPLHSAATTYAFTWMPDRVVCLGWRGRATKASQILSQHTFTANIPPAAAGVNARINLWLFNGQAPANGRELEVIIRRFDYEPLP